MLGGSQVFGWRAGTHAASVAKDRPQASLRAGEVDRLLGWVARAREQTSGGTRPQHLLQPLQREMWMRLLVEKDAEQLAAARSFIAKQRERLEDDLLIAEPFDLVLLAEQRNLLDVAEVITAAADMRKESRGSHVRADYPARNDAEFMTNIMVSRENGELRLNKRWVNEATGWTDLGKVAIMPWG